jgi:serine O-acetyltransferase
LAAPRRDLYTRLLYARRSRLFGRLAYLLLKLLGAEVPLSVQIGEGVTLEHGAFGLVVHPNAVIGNRVKIYPGVTLGRADIYRPIEESKFEGIEIGDEAILSPGAKVLCEAGRLHVGAGTVLGANAVLLQSTGEGEVWVGMPAKRVGKRAGWPSAGAA